MLTESLNPIVSNGPFKQKKKEILRHSRLNLNLFLTDEAEWNEGRIIARSEELREIAKGIWSYPKNYP